MAKIANSIRRIFRRTRGTASSKGSSPQPQASCPSKSSSPDGGPTTEETPQTNVHTSASVRIDQYSLEQDGTVDFRATPQTKPAPTMATDNPGTSTNPACSSSDLGLQLWDQAYDALKSGPTSRQLVSKYEQILSSQLTSGFDSQVPESQANDIDQADHDKRRHQMECLTRKGLERTAREAQIKAAAGVTVDIVLSARDIVSSALEAMPQLALAWAGLSVALQLLVNPIQQTAENREGIQYVISQMNWYCGLAGCLLRRMESTSPDTIANARKGMEAQIIDLYKALLSYQMKSVCSYYAHRQLIFLRDLVGIDDWKGDLATIREAEQRFRADATVFSLLQVNSYLESLSLRFSKLLEDKEAERRYESERACSSILAALYFNTMTDREGDITDAHKKTFQWLLGVDDMNQPTVLVDWLRGPGSLFWLTGKAGSGKSTLMKLIYRDSRLIEHLSSWACGDKITMAGFFFYDLGSSRLQKSLEGFLRSVLHQILTSHPEWIQSVFATEYKAFKDNPTSWDTRAVIWSRRRLIQAFQDILQHFGAGRRLFLCIDGLDEYRRLSASTSDARSAEFDDQDREQQARYTSEDRKEIAQLIKNASLVSGVKMFVSGRPLTTFEDAFSGYPTLPLHEITAKDIGSYVQDLFDSCERIKAAKLGDDALSIVLRNEVVSKANGVFLWVRVVVDKTLSLAQRGRTGDELLNGIRLSPSELTGKGGLFSRMMQDLDPQDLSLGARIFRLVLASDVPITPLMLRFAEEARIAVFNPRLRVMSEEEVEEARELTRLRLKSMCAGLLEIGRPEEPPDGQKTYRQYPSKTINFIHRTAREFILGFLSTNLPGMVPDKSSSGPHESILAAYVSRLKYALHVSEELELEDAVKSAIRCAYSAQQQGESHVDLLDELDKTMTMLEPQLLENVASERDRSKLRKMHWVAHIVPQRGGWPNVSDEPEHEADFMSLAVEASLIGFIQHQLETRRYNVTMKRGRPLLTFAVFNYRDSWLETPSHPDTVKLLLAHGADPNQIYENRTPWQLALQWAYNSKVIERSAFEWCRTSQGKRWTENVGAMVKAGADVNAWLWIRVWKGRRTYSPLYVIIDILRGDEGARDEAVSKMRIRGARLNYGEKDLIKQEFADPSRITIRTKEETRQQQLESWGRIKIGCDFLVAETWDEAIRYSKRLETLLEQIPEGELTPKPYT